MEQPVFAIMKDSAAILFMNSMMSGNDNDYVYQQTDEVPTTSQDGIDFLAYNDDNNVFYSENSGPMWTDSIIELSSSNASSTMDSQMTDILPAEGKQTEDPILDLVKGELKHRIRSRRHASGQDDIVVDFTPQQKTEDPNSQEDEIKQQLRREKNRLAAQKCRGKKRERAEHLEGIVHKLETKQSRISEEIDKLRTEKEHLEDLISVHGSVCPKMRQTSNNNL